MTENTHYLKMPYIVPAQAQKHVTHNEALRMLDAVVQLSVKSIGANDVPASPTEGDRYVIGASPTGEWAAHANKVTAFVDGTWIYFVPQEGWLAWDQSRSGMLAYSGTEWGTVSTVLSDNVARVGINGSATDHERLVVQSNSVLFNHDGSDHRMKLNKSGAGNTTSLLFQSGFSGRAEFGLPGEDNFLVKVSGDGASWHEAIRVNNANGEVSFPASGTATSALSTSSLLPDSGRFHSSTDPSAVTSSAPTSPSYISSCNGATISFPFKFIHDNSTYGGASAALDPIVKDLIVKVFGASGLRYGPEFWCMQAVGGSGTSWAINIDGETYWNATLNVSAPRPPKYTVGYFVRAKTGKLALRSPYGSVNRILRDGQPANFGTSSVVITPQDGWTYFEAQIARAVAAYDHTDMTILLNDGGSAYFALPRLVDGWVSMGENLAIVTNNRVFGD